MARVDKSEYLLSLENENKDVAKRYPEKILIIEGIDPYTLTTGPMPLCEELYSFPPVDAFDIVNYLVLTHGFYTNQQMKAHKSLSAYKYFKAGFVHNCQTRKIGAHVVIVAQSVNSHGVVGSYDDNQQEECPACLKGTCRSINGLYTRPDLPPGYSLVAQIPQGACRILVQQLKHTRNYLALRNANSSYIVNGDWKFSNSRTVEGGGTKFTYIKQDGTSLETITSPGPLSNPVDIMIVNYQSNPGIKYGYSLPIDPGAPSIAPPLLKRPAPNIGGLEPRRLDPPINSFDQKDQAKPPVHRRTRVRRKFAWKITGVSACSKSCGGGIQTTVVTCVRDYTQLPVVDRRCAHLERQSPQPIRCNVQDCPPQWKGEWGTCSVTCGDGVEQFVYHCQQEMATGRIINVNDNACPKPRPMSQTRPCNAGLCENMIDNDLTLTPPSHVKDRKEWTIGPWSSCSVSCGTGHRTRSVTCPSGQCRPEDRPKHAEYCDTGPCTTSPTGETSPWLFTEWSHCSSACGTGTQTRLTVCSRDKCDSEDKPETTRACSSDKQCGGQWFTGPWGPCSDSCSGPSMQKRDVYCIVRIRGHARITNEMTCPSFLKPDEEQPCNGQCPPRWFIGEWGRCECPSEAQRRTVKCLDGQGRDSSGCVGTEMPLAKRQCACQRQTREDEYKQDSNRMKPAQDQPSDSSCVDKIRNCYLAVQARLCQYPYYTNHCCVSCRRAQHDLE